MVDHLREVHRVDVPKRPSDRRRMDGQLIGGSSVGNDAMEGSHEDR